MISHPLKTIFYIPILIFIFRCAEDPEAKSSVLIRVPSTSSIETELHALGIDYKLNKSDHLFKHYEIRQLGTEQRDIVAKLVHRDSGCGGIYPAQMNLSATLTEPESEIFQSFVALPKVKDLLSAALASNIETTVKSLEAITTRFHSSTTGISASETIRSLLATAHPTATVSLSSHASSSQKSVILSLSGTTDDATTVIVGAHLDSINSSSSSAPGADDNATGIASLVEVARVLKAAGATFKRRVELHAYAAEEVGLIGSYDLANSYKSAGRKIAAVMNLDMNGYPPQKETVFLISNSTSSWLRRRLLDLSANYIDNVIEEKSLSSGTSDHASWNNAGYHTVFPFEDPSGYNSLLHTANDKSNVLNFSYSLKFTKLALAFLAHHAGLESANAQYDAALAAKKAELKLDLKFGFQKSGSDRWYISIASDQNLSAVEICTLSKKGNSECSDARQLFSLAKTQNNRLFYVSTSTVSLTDGQVIRARGYISNGQLGFERTVTLKKK